MGKSALSDQLITRTFETWWPELEKEFQIIQQSFPEPEIPLINREKPKTIQPTTIEETLDEILEILNRTPDRSAMTVDVNCQPRNRIFLIHGHNNEIKESVARFLESLDLGVIILHEQPNKGQTIIEKLESFSEVDYAIALLTGDDKGDSIKSSNKKSGFTRARQNVIFEMGYFASSLGRNRLTILYEEGVEVPSDISGILYIPLDSSNSWRLKLTQELISAGLKIDLNLLFPK